MSTYTVVTADGRSVAAVRLPLPTRRDLAGYHLHKEGQRLDHIAARYLKDPTGFWQLCDANDAVAPDALAQRDLIGVPRT